MFPALSVGQQATVANGRTCSGTPGTAVDVPDFDARNLAANGWISRCPDWCDFDTSDGKPEHDATYLAKACTSSTKHSVMSSV